MASEGGGAAAVTAVFTVAEVLFSSFDSLIASAGSTEAVLVREAAVAGAVTRRVMVPFWPSFTRPPVQVTVVGPGAAADVGVQTNRLVVVTDVSATPVGRVSVTTMPVAGTAPMLLTVRV